MMACRAPYGARGLKSQVILIGRIIYRRAPYGARGLKYKAVLGRKHILWSRPVWGAWIEMLIGVSFGYNNACRAPYGARGLK